MEFIIDNSRDLIYNKKHCQINIGEKMGIDIEERLKAQSEGEKKTSGNLINDRRAMATFHPSEDVGVVEVNWKGLYQDCKYAWISVGVFMILMLYGVWSLSSKGYFESKKVSEDVTKVRILEVTNYFGKKILIAGEVTNNIPVEVRLPQKCVVDPRWIGSEVELKAEKFQNNQTKTTSFQFTGVENLCDSTEGYLKAKKERERMKDLVHKISSYDFIPDIVNHEQKHENKEEATVIGEVKNEDKAEKKDENKVLDKTQDVKTKTTERKAVTPEKTVEKETKQEKKA